MIFHPVCVCGVRAGRDRVARKEPDSEARARRLLLGRRSHYAQHAGLRGLVQRDRCQA